MSNDWAVEAHDKDGRRFLYRRIADRKEVRKLVAQVLAKKSTGGVVIYRSTVAVKVTPGSHDAWHVANPNHPCEYTSKPVIPDCETAENENPENFEKVADSNNEGCHCGCPPDDMPMVNRGTGYCCERHRKEQLAMGNE